MTDSVESSLTSVLQAWSPRLCDGLADGLEGLRVRPGGVHKDRVSVVGKLSDGFQDVRQRSVPTVFVGGLVIGLGEPLLGKLFDGGDIDVAIVQVGVNFGQVFLQEHPIRSNRVAGQRRTLSIRNETLDVGEDLLARLLKAYPLTKFIEEATGGVHIANEITHLGKSVRRGLDDDLEPRIYRVEVVVGNDQGHFDEFINEKVKARHLTVCPDEQRSRRSRHPGSLPGERCAGQADDIRRGEAKAEEAVDHGKPGKGNRNEERGDAETSGSHHHDQ